MPAASGDLLTTPSNTKVKTRWKEQYVSEGLNRKLKGVVGHGVLRGFRLGTSAAALTVDLEVDPSLGDSILSFIDANDFQLTYRESGVLSLDLSAQVSTTVFIAAYIDYTVSSQTVVQWRAYTAAQLAAETEKLFVAGQVVVPAAGVIPAANITPLGRETSWEDSSPGASEWVQVVENGGHERSKLGGAAFGGPAEPWPGWNTQGGLVENGGLAVSVVTTAPRSGDNELRMALSGAASQLGQLLQGTFIQVRPGQFIRPSVWVRGASVSPGPGASGHIGLFLYFFDAVLALDSTVYVEDTSLTGTFAYTELTKIIEVPSTARFVAIGLVYDDDNNNSTGDVFFDDLRLWVERNQARDDATPDSAKFYDGSVRTKSLDIVPAQLTSGSFSNFIDRIMQLKTLPFVGSINQLLLQSRDGGSTPFDWLLKNGGLSIERAISSLGAELLGSSADALTPRVSGDVAPAATETYTLLFELTSPDNLRKIRCYMEANSTLAFTVNAFWDGAQWDRDGVYDSLLVEFDLVQFNIYHYDSADAAPWNHADWDDDAASGFANTHIDGSLDLLRGLAVGQNAIGSAADAYTIPRLFGWSALGATSPYTLLMWFDDTTTGNKTVRFYHGPGTGSYDGLIITVNALWNGSQWQRDAAGDSTLIRFDNSDVYIEQRDSTSASPWADGAFDAVGSGARLVTFDIGSALDLGETRSQEITPSQKITDLGVDFINAATAAGNAEPRINGEISDSTDGRYVCLMEMIPDTISPLPIRIYLTEDSATGESPLSVAFCITINAFWDGTDWEKDIPSVFGAFRYDFGAGIGGEEAGIAMFAIPNTRSTAWTDAQWADGTNGKRLWGIDNDNEEARSRERFYDGRILFENTTTGADGSNPPPGDYVANLICAKNAVKAWARVAIASGTPTVETAFNFNTTTAFSNGALIIDFDVAFTADNDYAAVILVEREGSGTTAYFATLDPSESDQTQIGIRVFDGNNTEFDLTAGSLDLHIIVLGEYAS